VRMELLLFTTLRIANHSMRSGIGLMKSAKRPLQKCANCLLETKVI
jgi:hypothetical protein